MTPLPKKRHAKARTRTRKAAIKLKLPTLVKCPNCDSLKLPHRACSKCGTYNNNKEKVTKNENKGRSKA